MSRQEQIADLENRYLLPTYSRYPVALEKGKGVYLFDFEFSESCRSYAQEKSIGAPPAAKGESHAHDVTSWREGF